MVVRLVVQIAFRPRRAIVERISQLSQRILFVAEKVGRRTIHDGIHLAMLGTDQFIRQVNHIVEIRTVIVIILQMQDRVFVSILESKRTVQVVAETVVHLVWRTVERKPKVTALLKTLQGEFVEFVVGQIENAGEIITKSMFGEYGLFSDKKIFALICDNKLFIKPTESGRLFIKDIAIDNFL